MRRGSAAQVLTGSVLGIALSPGTIVFYSLGVFLDPISRATGWSHGEISFAASVFTFALIFSIPVVGRLLDRYGVRAVLPASVLLFGAMLFLTGVTRSLAEFYVAFALLAALGAGANSVSYMRAVCTWFDRRRGLAIGVAQAGMGLGVMVMPHLTERLLQLGGWQFAYRALGLAVCLAVLPAVALLVRENDGNPRESGDRSLQGSGDTWRAFRSARLWLLILGFMLLAGAINSTALHLVDMAESAGASRQTSLMAATAFGAFMFAGRLATGLLLDLCFAPYVAAVLFCGSMLAMMVLAGGATGTLLLAAASVVGLSAGADGDLASYLVSRYFPMKSFASLGSCVFCAYLVGTALFPWLVGLAVERLGSYRVPMQLCAGLCAGAMACMLLLGSYPATHAHTSMRVQDA